MDVSLYECFQGMKVQTHNLEVLSNNLSNINTTGFKAETPFFEVLQNSLAGSAQAGYIQASTTTNYQQGALTASDNALDLALEGKGFFCVKTPTGLAYTRDGSFQMDAQGYLITSAGHRVQGVAGNNRLSDIRLEKGKVEVDTMGNVNSSGVSMGVLKIADFSNYAGLEKVGDNLFRPVGPAVKEIKADNWVVQQGFKEDSNVSPTSSMVEMITILRRFEMLQKAMNSLMNEVDKQTIEQVGKSRA